MIEWRSFLDQQQFEQLEANYICDADNIGLILVTGEDARSFLQNQLSNDIDQLDERHFQLNSYSTPKGRLLAVFRIVQISNGYILITTRSLVMSLLERLSRYVVQAKVILADASDHFTRVAIQSDRENVVASDLLAAQPGMVFQNDDLISLQLEPQDRQKRYLVFFLQSVAAIAMWRSFSDELKPGNFSAWRLAEINAGIPSIYPATSEQFVLQMANLNWLGGVSFNKGCFPGQEIVARMQYLGKIKRRMFLATVETSVLPGPGDNLVVRGATQADGSGQIVDAEYDCNGSVKCLYIARIDRVNKDRLCLLNQPDAIIHNHELPYAIVG